MFDVYRTNSCYLWHKCWGLTIQSVWLAVGPQLYIAREVSGIGIVSLNIQTLMQRYKGVITILKHVSDQWQLACLFNSLQNFEKAKYQSSEVLLALCEENSLVNRGFSWQRVSNAESFYVSWRLWDSSHIGSVFCGKQYAMTSLYQRLNARLQ